jgi:hypothetical protein
VHGPGHHPDYREFLRSGNGYLQTILDLELVPRLI